MGEGGAPHACELAAGIGARVFVALKIVLVHELHGVGFGEVLRMPVPCGTNQARLLETAKAVQASVVLDVGSEGRLLAEVKLARDFGVCSFREFAAEVDIHEIVPRTSLVGLKLFKSHGQFLTASFFVRIE